MRNINWNLTLVLAAAAGVGSTHAQDENTPPIASPAEVAVTVHADQPKAISPDLFGIFFEDLNWAADGGLYTELVQNRSFEYRATEQPTWNPLTSWGLATRGDGQGSLAIDDAVPLHRNNPHYLVLDVARVGEGVGVVNPGFDGIPVKAGNRYEFSVFAHQLYMGSRWGSDPNLTGKPMPLTVRLENQDGNVLGETSLEVAGREWSRYAATITPSKTETAARLVLLARARGGVALDVVSLFPHDTFHGRLNGLRADLAQVIADLKPAFVCFPGGCLAHGNGLGNMYR